ncbi:hypothetical protein AVEN_171643-2-1, partial [Araneus ventricosus]
FLNYQNAHSSSILSDNTNRNKHQHRQMEANPTKHQSKTLWPSGRVSALRAPGSRPDSSEDPKACVVGDSSGVVICPRFKITMPDPK